MLMRMFEGFSDNAKVAIYAAYVESRRLGAPAAGSEHLLLGIVTTAPGPATIFAGSRVTPAEVERLIAIVGPALPERPVRGVESEWGTGVGNGPSGAPGPRRSPY